MATRHEQEARKQAVRNKKNKAALAKKKRKPFYDMTVDEMLADEKKYKSKSMK